MKTIRVLIADDHVVLRPGLRMLLDAQPDIEVIGEVSDGHEALKKTVEFSPDVLLLDITMPSLSGIDVIKMIQAKEIQVVILVLTMHETEEYILEALRAGAQGYIPKKASETELIPAIRAVHSGAVYIHASLSKALVKAVIHGSAIDNNQGLK